HRVSVEAYQRDILLGDPLTRELLERHGRTLTYFRHPYLNTGRSVEVRLGVDGFLSRHGYRVAPVTIYLEDYVFAAAYDWALMRGLPASFLDGEPETPRFVHRHARSPLHLALLRRVVRFREALRLRVKRPLARRLRRLLSRAASGATSRARSG